MFTAVFLHNPVAKYWWRELLQLVMCWCSHVGVCAYGVCVCVCGLFWLPFSSCQPDLLNRVLFFYVCVHCVCVSMAWCKHNIRRDVYCNMSVWCQLSWAASCLEKRMTVWLFDDNVSLASHFLSSVSLKNADIKCLMLACTTDVQIKTSPVRHDFFFLLAFWQYICCFCCFQIRFKFTFSPFLKVWIVLSLIFFLLEPESCQNWGAKTKTNKQTCRVAYDLRNKCFPLEHHLVFGVYSMTLWCQRVEVVLVEERQVNMTPNKAWVHFPAALPPGHRPLHIQVKSAFCLPKPCDLWPGSIDQTS